MHGSCRSASRPQTLKQVTEDSEEDLKVFCTKLYVLLFECLADAGQWSTGLAVTPYPSPHPSTLNYQPETRNPKPETWQP